jgi:uncharacterized membrane protein YcaP (DUF421 family)
MSVFCFITSLALTGLNVQNLSSLNYAFYFLICVLALFFFFSVFVSYLRTHASYTSLIFYFLPIASVRCRIIS